MRGKLLLLKYPRENLNLLVVRSLKVRIVTELTKAPNFAQLIAYCSTMNIRGGAQCKYATEAC